MFREMHYMDRTTREMDFTEKVAERRRQSLAAASKSSRKARIARMLFALGGSLQAEGRA
jgi:hypothetical protein